MLEKPLGFAVIVLQLTEADAEAVADAVSEHGYPCLICSVEHIPEGIGGPDTSSYN